MVHSVDHLEFSSCRFQTVVTAFRNFPTSKSYCNLRLAALVRIERVTAGLEENNGSLPLGL